MKRLMSIFGCVFLVLTTIAQEHKETIRKEITLPESKNAVLVVENIFGNIEVEGYDGENIIFEIKSEIKAHSEKELKEAMEKVFLTFETRLDTVHVFPDGLCGCHRNKYNKNNWNQCNFKFKYDFKLKVPERANINVSTINDGEVKIRHISGEVVARNINGGITAEEISGMTNIHTINGNVEVRYSKNPNQDSKYYTLNGNVNVYYFPELSADLSFKSFQGNMFTNFSTAEKLPPVIVQSSSKNDKSTTYRIENRTAFRIGKGGVKLDFETFNGNVFIRKI
jgi:hypothetical protein